MSRVEVSEEPILEEQPSKEGTKGKKKVKFMLPEEVTMVSASNGKMASNRVFKVATSKQGVQQEERLCGC